MADTKVTRRASLHEVYQIGSYGEIEHGKPGLTISERVDLSLVQVAAWKDTANLVISVLEKALGIKMDTDACRASHANDLYSLWLGPDRWVLTEKEHRDLYALIRNALSDDMAAITDQSHSRCVLRITGPRVRNLLAKGTTLDLDPVKFIKDDVRTSNLFHMNASIHCLEDDCFDVYVARSFGQSFFEVICHAAMEYGYQVVEPA